MELDPVIRTGLPVALFLIMLSMGMTLGAADFRRVVIKPRAFGVGFASQMLLPPILAICLVMLFALPPELAVGLMVLSFCPSGTTSNLFSHLSGADVALSISLTAVASLVTPFTLPLLTEQVLVWQTGAGQPVPFPVLKTTLQLAVIVLLPVSAGMLWRHRASSSCARWQPVLQRFSILLFVLVIIGIVVQQRGNLPRYLAMAGAVCVLMVLAAMTFGWLIARVGRLPVRQRKTVSIEVGMQHGGMALVVTQGVLMNPTMSVVPLMYGLLMLIPVITLVVATRWRDRQARLV